ncbi:MAG: hypothetical protein ACRDV8_09310, partial [Acidimicrobiales bacterium]
MQSPTVPERFRPLVEATESLADRFRACGHRVYLVGGSVRDALVERGPARASTTTTDPTADPAATPTPAAPDTATDEAGPAPESDYD